MSLLELHLRQQQANRYIVALQEVIAEKSFQYSNVIRVAPVPLYNTFEEVFRFSEILKKSF